MHRIDKGAAVKWIQFCYFTGFTDSEREISQNAILSQQKRISNSQDDIDDDEIEDAGPGKDNFSLCIHITI